MEILKKYLLDIVAVVVFAVISYAYFVPATIDGRILYQHDASAGRGATQELAAYREKTGETSRWTNATFSGMPTYQTAPSYKSTSVLSAAEKVYHLWLPNYVWYVFAYLLGFYILLRAFDFRRSLAVLGSVIWAFSSYFFIIIAAGHIWKVMALAYLPPMIAGVVLAYRGKFVHGLILTAIFSAFEIYANHVQMTYYYLFIILFMVIAYLVQAVREKQMTRFLKATLACVIGAALGICINLSNLYHTWQYGQESMRGKSELVKKNTANQTNSGLERDYITQWSYGVGETWTLLIPNAKGGTSAVPMSANKIVQEKGNPELAYLYQQIGQYWGEQPGTSGPVYVGAFVLMLFILGLFIVKGPMKWALLAATVLSVLLSWGKNFMGLTDFFIDYVPMYAKFRTVASILVIAEFTIPLLAILALKQIIDEPDSLKNKMKYVYVSFGLTAGFAFLFALMPGVFFSDFVSSSEMQALSQFPPEQLNPILTDLRSVRQSIFAADCWRTFWIIVIGTAFLLLYKARKLKAIYAIGGIAVLCLVDMWQVNKRYLNDDMFVESSIRDTPPAMTATDRQILQDKALNYRVLNLASNTFNENETSYYHKSIGGYHAAKLRRYQEMIEAYISPEMQSLMSAVVKAGGDMTKVNGDSIYPVLNMLNTKYFILPLQNNQTVPLQNPYTFGNAWLVDKITYVDNANAELDAVGKINLKHEAVADMRFKTALGESKTQGNVAKAEITQYAPNQLTYRVESDKGGVLVFSEIYYPEWTATVDGQPVELGRVNYILRAINIKPGQHEVTLTFEPQSVTRTELVAYISYAILLILVGGILVWNWKKRKFQ
ncbi:YfhO family protein [Hoylesella saccharolytica]|uniref:YfhO family protein n=1 Tax=Hoylesella saccharolytica TaxID=633701 RepID=UPI0028EACA94|nr:YfhO family protein [Hoylesella saccharolytica]